MVLNLRPTLSLRLALAWLVLVVMLAVLAPWLPLLPPNAAQPAVSLHSPTSINWLGADLLGRDVLSRMVWGARRTLGMALLAVLVTGGAGALIGLSAGYSGGTWDSVAMRTTDVALALPQLLIALVLVTALGPSPGSVGLAVGLAGVASFARLARSAAQQVRGQLYIQAAEALGAAPREVLTRHILRNVAPALASFVTIHFAWAVLNTATLTFLGFGGSPSAPDWGLILNEGRPYLLAAPWVSTAPGVALTLTVLAANTVGAHWDQLLSPASQ